MAFTNPQYLVEPEWLEAHLNQVRVVDVTAMLTSKLENLAMAECFERNHIPGSLFLDVASGYGDLSAPDAPLPWTWPGIERFSATMARFGISNDTRVIIVARTPRDGIDNGTMWCTRAWWTMHHGGVDCAILNGGIERWVEEARPMTSTASPNPKPGSFAVDSSWLRGHAGLEEVQAAVDSPTACLVDALSVDSFDGTRGGYGPRKGHITSAINVPMSEFVTGNTARFRGADEIEALLRDSSLLDAPKVITYCGGAIAATVDAFALALFGHPDVSVYDGSLMEWTANPDLPMTDPNPSEAP